MLNILKQDALRWIFLAHSSLEEPICSDHFQDDHFKVRRKKISAGCERLQSVSTVKLVFITTKTKWMEFDVSRSLSSCPE
jgi:hypothetical protein